ncbi:geranylgeranyl transferase type-1 subunit beta [Anaeramoeba flamelloides]|uniref:Geranylgeranyl transferase type-1 subunit beta n=1 Tax=Anaeramoeba flamelloides TaxID=1746091 RepID=A0AAV8A9V6_9EUKA|nr:geranylgeranyl transferase type-1 subunit beta [Anaeramoeba flamelloides]
MSKKEFNRRAHIEYFNLYLNMLPQPIQSMESNRMTILYFAISGLDMLGATDRIKSKEVIEWVYAQQIVPDSKDENKLSENCGFRCGPLFGCDYNPECSRTSTYTYDRAHVAMTYTALSILKILGDDLERIDSEAVVNATAKLQQEDGSVAAISGISETDLRYMYCSCVIYTFLDNWGTFDIEKATKYILSCQSYDGGFGLVPNGESHGGSSYCAIASLALMNKLDSLPDKDFVIDWLLRKQTIGFQGRVNKPPDTCYSFWVGASLEILGSYELIDYDQNEQYIFCCQDKLGGFSKWSRSKPDPLHSYFGICGLSLMDKFNLPKINPLYGFRDLTLERPKIQEETKENENEEKENEKKEKEEKEKEN